MKLLKLEQPNCRNCGFVAAFLDDKGVKYTTVDVSKNTDVAVKYGIMTTPVTILLDENNNEVQRSLGYNRSELEEIVSKL
jgi:thioredoxin 1